MHPADPLTAHFRLTPTQVSALKRLGIYAVRDLLYHFPARYDEAGSESAINGLVPGTEATLFGTLSKLDTRRSWKRRIPVGEARLADGTGSIKIMWFHQPYLAKKYAEGMFVKAVGVVGGTSGKLYLANPHVEAADPADAGLFAKAAQGGRGGALFAVYPESRGITSLWVRHAIERLFTHGALEHLQDPLPPDMLARYHLPALSTALSAIHRPDDLRHAEAARKRFAFEEILAIQIARARERVENDAQSAFPITNAEPLARRFLAALPYKPTSAQRRAITDILGDFDKSHPMARLLEGDVGSGKTLVAAATAYAVVHARPPGRNSGTLQVAYMAPTEILAGQHFASFIEYFRDLPINIGLITGSGCKKFPSKSTGWRTHSQATDISRAQLLKWVANGEIAMLVGTHALIQKAVKFQHLAYAIVDEQHRFGTAQRRALAKKSDTVPHFLSMTATPIPRTLALTLYGDLDLSILDELPPERVKITTEIIQKGGREQAYARMREHLARGEQVYVICPRIEEPDPAKMNALQAKSAKAEAQRLQKDVFPEYTVGLLHGAMPAKGGSASGGRPSKESVMKDFSDGKIQVLVATSVVEVGVNVPNATIILIEGAERFGLAQLHQLRGRVQRSAKPPYCLLAPEAAGEMAMKRLRTLASSADGFKLAEADLEARGAGDLYGRQQWGVSDLGMEALKNIRLIRAAREEAQRFIAEDPILERYPALKARAAEAARALHTG